MTQGAWALLAVLACVAVPRLGAEDVTIIGRDFTFETPGCWARG